MGLKLDEVLENTRDQYLINILEEGTTELSALKTKKFLRENTALIRKILVEEGIMKGVQTHLAKNWGKYAGAGLAAAGAAGAVNNSMDNVDNSHQHAVAAVNDYNAQNRSDNVDAANKHIAASNDYKAGLDKHVHNLAANHASNEQGKADANAGWINGHTPTPAPTFNTPAPVAPTPTAMVQAPEAKTGMAYAKEVGTDMINDAKARFIPKSFR